MVAWDLAVVYIGERERETYLPHRNRNSHSARPRRGGDMPVEVSIVLTLVITLTGPACWGLGCHIRERETCLPHRNRKSHCPRRGGVDMPVEVSTVLTLVINKPLTGCVCWGLGCHIRERETCLPHRNRLSHCPRWGGVDMPVYRGVILTLVIHSRGLLFADSTVA